MMLAEQNKHVCSRAAWVYFRRRQQVGGEGELWRISVRWRACLISWSNYVFVLENSQISGRWRMWGRSLRLSWEMWRSRSCCHLRRDESITCAKWPVYTLRVTNMRKSLTSAPRVIIHHLPHNKYILLIIFKSTWWWWVWDSSNMQSNQDWSDLVWKNWKSVR